MKKTSVFILLSVLLLTGCASTQGYRTSSLFEGYFNSARMITVMPPDIEIHLLTAGGIDEIRDEWSDIGKANVLNAVREELGTLPLVKTSVLDMTGLSEAEKDFVKEQNGLHDAVTSSIVWHTYIPASTFKHKLNNFDYTLGPEISGLPKASESDALLFCTAKKYVWTAGRTSTAIFGVLVGAATGVYIIPMSGPEFVLASLVDAKTGDVIWFQFKPSQVDWRNEEVCSKSIKDLFKSFPKGGK